MAFPHSFLRQTFIWQLPQGEVANCRVHWTNDTGFIGVPDAIVDALATRGTDWWTNIKESFAPETLYIGCRVQLVGSDGLIVEGQERIIAGVPGTGLGENLPTEVAEVVSLRTTQSGRSYRGRIYLPAMDTTRVDLNGRLATVTRNNTATYSSAMLANLTVGTVDLESVIASATLGALIPITEVRVGDVFDVQRRRRDNLLESYATSPV